MMPSSLLFSGSTFFESTFGINVEAVWVSTWLHIIGLVFNLEMILDTMLRSFCEPEGVKDGRASIKGAVGQSGRFPTFPVFPVPVRVRSGTGFPVQPVRVGRSKNHDFFGNISKIKKWKPPQILERMHKREGWGPGGAERRPGPQGPPLFY